MAIVFGLKYPTFLAKSYIFISKYTKGGSKGLGIIPKEYHCFHIFPNSYHVEYNETKLSTKHAKSFWMDGTNQRTEIESSAFPALPPVNLL